MCRQFLDPERTTMRFLLQRLHPVIMKYSLNFTPDKVCLAEGCRRRNVTTLRCLLEQGRPPSGVSCLRTFDMLHVAVPKPRPMLSCVFTHYSAELPTNGVNSTSEITTRFRSSDSSRSPSMPWLYTSA